MLFLTGTSFPFFFLFISFFLIFFFLVCLGFPAPPLFSYISYVYLQSTGNIDEATGVSDILFRLIS